MNCNLYLVNSGNIHISIDLTFLPENSQLKK